MKRTLTVLKEYKDICEKEGVGTIAAVGTFGFRKAKNAGDFVRIIKKETGINVEIISGEREAKLSFLSVSKDFQISYPSIVVCDIGGGSTEIIWQQQHVSLNLGCVDLLERFIKNDPPSDAEIDLLRQEVKKTLENEPLSDLAKTGPWDLIGLAGTCTTLSAINQRLSRYDPAKVHASKIHLGELSQTTAFLMSKTLAERQKISGMDPARADTIIPGAIILEEIMGKLNSKVVIISDHGVRHGLFWEKVPE